MSAALDWTMLRTHFVTKLEVRLDAMFATLGQLDTAPSAGARAALERQFHSLAGIAGTYGFHNITDLARQGELRCTDGSGTAAELRAVVRAIAIPRDESP
jgi:HPt (histidine-containing phosphotransfer) domain-containing protein